ncbi:MAG: Pimeloyl-ACP methyl ester carboxylesterase [Candidatus Kentron sp. G]|nr:MAG: Pimeloyl-ACP methyl ester carboxylesterase [Candidatus Kentron sp. G]VFN05243.1 MAG: Pimeloyl-ACP methyl ester carboxylesterase [Candidatus Kentron sp. G]VFN06141.1 MAG: Pimeloyl-ACP methyl ester carboxylesterase [Candidatus Kentron sp. G]
MPYATVADIGLYYEIHGTGGPALVFAHGGGGNATSWWQQATAFSADYRVVVFDHRGFARSPCPIETQNPRFFEGDLMAILDAADIHQATVVCQSMGGWTGMRAAVHYPDRIPAVFLANTPGAVQTQATRANMEGLQTRLEHAKLTNLAISQGFIDKNPALALLYNQIQAHNTRARPNLQDEAIYLTPDEVKDCGARFHVLASELDPLFPPDLLEGVAKEIGASYDYIHGAGHSTYFEKPQAFNAALRAFLGN